MNRNVGVEELLKNARLLAALTTVAFLGAAQLASVPLGPFHDAWTLKLSLTVAALGLAAGAGVMLKGPYGIEREEGLDGQSQKGLSLFYGLQIGCCAVAFVMLAMTLLF